MSHLKVVHCKRKSKRDKAKTEQHNITEENDDHEMVQNPSKARTVPAAEHPIVTEGNTAYGMIQNTSLVQLENLANQPVDTEETRTVVELRTVEQPIATEESTAYGITQEISSAAQAVDQQNNGQSEAAADETVYEVIPTNSDTEEFNAVQNTTPDGMEDEHIATEGNIAYGTVEQPIENTAYGITQEINSAAQGVDQHNNGQSETAADETVYEVIPTNSDTEEFNAVQNTTPDGMEDEHIATEGNIAYGTVEQPIENTAYGITQEINSAAQGVDQHNNGQSEAAADETVYEVIPSDTEEFNAVQSTSPDGMEGEHIATEGNIAYGMARDISSSAQLLTASFTDQNQQHSTAGDEAVYQVIPTRDATEESPTLGMVHNTTSDNALELSITTEGNISYGIARRLDSSQLTTSFDQHKTQNKQSSTGEAVYEAVATGNANDEYEYPWQNSVLEMLVNHSQAPADSSLPLQQQMDMTNVKEDPY